jgi:selenide,water dikinase
MNAPSELRLTQFSHGGGCGCKIAPALLSQMLAATPMRKSPAELLVGTESSDDAAVYQISASQAIVATTDFFMPIVDDPYDFGRIAATNAISDIYAMGATPIMALALVGMPIDKIPLEVIQRVLAGGEAVCADAGIPIAGGHSIDSMEPIYGLVAIGLVHPSKVKRNDRAQAGDVLILGKPLGVGILSAALKKGRLDDAAYRALIEVTTRLNRPGIALAELADVHAMTDVTGFGLGGHLLEICRGSGLAAEIDWAQVPIMPEAGELVRSGVATGASQRNWGGYGKQILLPADFEEWKKTILCDPQTSGGLLVACSKGAESVVLELFRAGGFRDACRIGELRRGDPGIVVR